MLDVQTVLLIFGVVFLLLAVTRLVIRKQKGQPSKQVKTAPVGPTETKPRMTEEQFKKSWRSLSYLMLLAAAGNLYMLYDSVTGALETGSYILWIDALFSLAAAVIAVLIWRLSRKKLVFAYLIVMAIPVMFFISTGHSLDAILRLFPLMLVYFVVKPVWEFMD
jgi:hypothetical protein